MLHLNNIKKSFTYKTILEGFSLHISPGEKIGLIGKNGAGKTTILKIIAGLLEPDKGEIIIAPKTSISYLPQERQCNSDNSLYDEMLTIFSSAFILEKKLREMESKMQQMSEESNDMEILLKEYSALQEKLDLMDISTIAAKIGKVLSGLGFKKEDYEKTTKHFSGGWQARAELAKILLEKPNLLLLDEPTNHLDLEAIEWLEEYLKGYGGSYIIVSHDRYLLDKLTEKTVEFENGKAFEYDGNYSYYLTEKEHRQKLQEEKYKNQQKYLDKTRRFVERFRYKATKASQVKSREKMMEKMDLVEDVEKSNQKIKFSFLFENQSGREVIEVKNLKKSYNDKVVIDKINFLVERGDVIAITGKNGTGKSTLIKIIADEVLPDKGRVSFGYNVKPAYFSQHQAEKLTLEKSILEELRDSSPLSITDEALRTILGCFLFVGDDVFKKISTLSGGEKSRIALSKIITQPSNLLLLDEPTNHLDISSLEVLEKALKDYEGTVLFITHDRFFMDKLANKIFEIEDGSLNIYGGNYTYYTDRKKKLLLQKESLKKEEPVLRKSPKIHKKRKKAVKKPGIENKIEAIENKIEKTENEIQSIEEKMAEASFFKDQANKEVIEEYSKLKKLLPDLYKKWEELAETE